jgi:hypothetical protein
MTILEMHLLISAVEEASLFDLPLGAIDRRRDGTIYEWLPQNPAECRAVLLSWREEGVIGAYRYSPSGNEELSAEAARAILGAPGRRLPALTTRCFSRRRAPYSRGSWPASRGDASVVSPAILI